MSDGAGCTSAAHERRIISSGLRLMLHAWHTQNIEVACLFKSNLGTKTRRVFSVFWHSRQLAALAESPFGYCLRTGLLSDSAFDDLAVSYAGNLLVQIVERQCTDTLVPEHHQQVRCVVAQQNLRLQSRISTEIAVAAKAVWLDQQLTDLHGPRQCLLHGP